MFTRQAFLAHLNRLTHASLAGMLLISNSCVDSTGAARLGPTVQEEASVPTVVFARSKAYKARVARFVLTLEEAGKRALEFQRAEGRMAWPAYHCLVVNDEYVFSQPRRKLKISLTGLYVSGKTGKVRRVKSEEDLKKTYGRLFRRNDISFGKALDMDWTGEWFIIPRNSWVGSVTREK